MSAAVAGPQSNLRGIAAMALAMGLFVTNDTLVKLALAGLPLGEVLSIRSAVAALLLFLLLLRAGDLGMAAYAIQPRVLARSALDTATTFAYVAALAVMPIASTTTIFMAAPLITTALAVPLLGEKVGWRRWSAILVGFLGAVVVMRPDPASFHAIAVLPLLAATLGSVRDIVTRGIGSAIPGSAVGLSGALMVALASAALAPWEQWHVPTLAGMAYMVGAAVAFAGGSLALVYAFRSAPVAVVSPLRYLLIFGALTSGYLVFGEGPDGWAAVGMVLVVAAGLYTLHRERLAAQAARRAKRTPDVPGATTGAPAPVGERMPGLPPR